MARVSYCYSYISRTLAKFVSKIFIDEKQSHFTLLNLLYSYQGTFYSMYNNDEAIRQKFKT